MSNLVSVIMPVYNGASTIALALKSLIAQTYQYWECIVVNDGSTDNTVEIVKSFDDVRIKLYDLGKNYGRGFARNEALSHCTGKYLCYLDADDFLHHEKILKQVKILEKDNTINLVACCSTNYNDNLEPVSVSSSKKTEKSIFHDGDPVFGILPSVMVRRDKASNYEYDKRLDVGEDIDFFSRYLDKSYYCVLPETLYYYRIANLSKKKLIYYSKEDIRRGFVLFERNKKAGIKVIVAQSAKYFIYRISLFFVNASFFISKRGDAYMEKFYASSLMAKEYGDKGDNDSALALFDNIYNNPQFDECFTEWDRDAVFGSLAYSCWMAGDKDRASHYVMEIEAHLWKNKDNQNDAYKNMSMCLCVLVLYFQVEMEGTSPTEKFARPDYDSFT